MFLIFMNFLFSPMVHAQTATAAAPAQPPLWMSMMPFVLMIGVFYFLVLRPQAKRQRETQKFLSELKRGHEVVTTSGIIGRVDDVSDLHVTLEIANNVRIKVLKPYVATLAKSIETQSKG